MDFLDLSRRNGAPPQNLARAPIDAHRSELLIRRIELRQENTSAPDGWRRKTGSHSSLPKYPLVGSKLNRRFAATNSGGIRPPELGPPSFTAIVRCPGEAGQK